MAIIDIDNSLQRVSHYYSKTFREIETGGTHKIKGSIRMMLEIPVKRVEEIEKNSYSRVLELMRKGIQCPWGGFGPR